VTEAPSGSVALELERARSSLEAARVLLEAGLRADAVSRAYYAMFHAASALLASVGRAARTHDGLRALVAEHFVRPGLLAPEHARAFARTAGDRGDADYNVAAVFEAEDVVEDVAAARALIDAVEALVSRPD
jgi:uncharacterized protein (UPF0332 family)